MKVLTDDDVRENYLKSTTYKEEKSAQDIIDEIEKEEHQ